MLALLLLLFRRVVSAINASSLCRPRILRQVPCCAAIQTLLPSPWWVQILVGGRPLPNSARRSVKHLAFCTDPLPNWTMPAHTLQDFAALQVVETACACLLHYNDSLAGRSVHRQVYRQAQIGAGNCAWAPLDRSSIYTLSKKWCVGFSHCFSCTAPSN